MINRLKTNSDFKDVSSTLFTTKDEKGLEYV